VQRASIKLQFIVEKSSTWTRISGVVSIVKKGLLAFLGRMQVAYIPPFVFDFPNKKEEVACKLKFKFKLQQLTQSSILRNFRG
jgi:hypothetical protein